MSTSTKKVLAVGLVCLDIINTVPHYPVEDTEVRATATQRVAGGNAANTATVLALLARAFPAEGTQSHFLGPLGGDPQARDLLAELRAAGVDMDRCPCIAGGASPTSYILRNEANGLRTIVHHRDLPELTDADFAAAVPNPAEFSWIHFECRRNLSEVAAMLVRSRAAGVPVSLELEKLVPGQDDLIPLADVVFVCKELAAVHGCADGPALLALLHQRHPHTTLVCPWGEAGAYAVLAGAADSADAIVFAPAHHPAHVVDTLGAGDTFNAAFLHAWLRAPGALLPALAFANRVAGTKCGVIGFRDNLLAALQG